MPLLVANLEQFTHQLGVESFKSHQTPSEKLINANE